MVVIILNVIDVINPIHISTTYSYSNNPDELVPGGLTDPNTLVYSREIHAAQIEAIIENYWLSSSHL